MCIIATLVVLGLMQRTKCGEAAFIFSISTCREFYVEGGKDWSK